MPRPNRGGTKPSTKRPPPTHFLCLPLRSTTPSPLLSASLSQFHSDILTSSLPASAIRPAGTLHLTLGVLSLPTSAHLEAAITHLQSLDLASLITSLQPSHASLDSGGITSPPIVSLEGLHAMQAPAKTSVLYAEPVAEGLPLRAFGEALREGFVESGVMQREERGLKLHVTVFNTIYARGRGGGRGAGKGPDVKTRTSGSKAHDEAERGGNGSGSGEEGKGAEPVRGKRSGGSSGLKIDARPLLELYEGHVWGQMKIEKVAVCKMGAQKVFAEDGVTVIDERYEEMASIDMPTINQKSGT